MGTNAFGAPTIPRAQKVGVYCNKHLRTIKGYKAMNFLELSKKRQSCRNFNPEKLVSKETIQYCLEAAQLTPSACNSQPWHFTVIQKQENNTEDSFFQKALPHCGMEINKFVKNATAIIIISDSSLNATAAIGSVLKKQDFKSNDIGSASTYLTLAAEEKGLSSCILGWFNEKPLQKLCNIKGKIHLLVALGYANDGDKLRDKKRKDIETIVTWK